MKFLRNLKLFCPKFSRLLASWLGFLLFVIMLFPKCELSHSKKKSLFILVFLKSNSATDIPALFSLFRRVSFIFFESPSEHLRAHFLLSYLFQLLQAMCELCWVIMFKNLWFPDFFLLGGRPQILCLNFMPLCREIATWLPVI